MIGPRAWCPSFLFLVLVLAATFPGLYYGISLRSRSFAASDPDPLLDFVPNSELFGTCEEIIHRSEGRPGAVQAVCLDRAKRALDKKYEGKRRPPGSAMRLLEECEELEARAEKDRTSEGKIPATKVCGKIAMDDSKITGAPLPEYVPPDRLKDACARSFDGDAYSEAKCLESYDKALKEKCGLTGDSLAPTYCAQVKSAAQEPVTDKRTFCADLSTKAPEPVEEDAGEPAAVEEPKHHHPAAVDADGDDSTVSVEHGGITVPARLRSSPPPFVPLIGDASFGKGKGKGAAFSTGADEGTATAAAGPGSTTAAPAAAADGTKAKKKVSLEEGAAKSEDRGVAKAEESVAKKTTNVDTAAAGGAKGQAEKAAAAAAKNVKERSEKRTEAAQDAINSFNSEAVAKNQGDAPPSPGKGEPKAIPSGPLPRKMSTQDVKNSIP